MGHDLRSPLHGMMGLCNVLLQNPHGQLQDHEKVIQLIETSGSRMQGLINNILDAGSAKYGSLIMHEGVVDIADVAQKVVQTQQAMRPPKVVLSNAIPSGVLPRVSGDATRCNQILSNLVSNALKCTSKGSVTVDARRDTASNMLEIEVRDTGSGIEPEKLQEIWEPFKLDPEVSRRHGGRGLGLPLVKKLVTAHGGQFGVESTRGRGSRFWFTLPLASDADSQREASDVSTLEEEMASFVVRTRPLGAMPVRCAALTWGLAGSGKHEQRGVCGQAGAGLCAVQGPAGNESHGAGHGGG